MDRINKTVYNRIIVTPIKQKNTIIVLSGNNIQNPKNGLNRRFARIKSIP